MSSPLRCLRLPALLLLLLFGLDAASAQTGQEIEHVPPRAADSGIALEIRARVKLNGRSPDQVRLYFRGYDENDFRHIELTGSFNVYSGSIPAEFVQGPAVHYFIAAMVAGQPVASYPPVNPFAQPVQLRVRGGNGAGPPASTSTGALADGFALPLSPDPNELLSEEEVVIAASFQKPVDPQSVRIFINNSNLTRRAQITEYMILLSPRKVPAGSYQIVLRANNPEGQAYPPVTWRFQIAYRPGAAAERGKNYTGRIYSQYNVEQQKDVEESAFAGGGYLSGKAGAFRHNSRVFVTSLEDNRLQPLNRFSFQATSQHLDLGMGDVHPYFNDLVLWGRRVRGVHAALKTRAIALEFVTGYSNRRVRPLYDSSNDTLLTAFGSFGQRLTAGKLRLGDGQTFELGVSLLKARDDVNIDDVNIVADKTLSPPRDNLVGGVNLLLVFDRRRIELKLSSAYSLLTNDISDSALTQQELLDDFGIDSPVDPARFASWIIFNETTLPLKVLSNAAAAFQGSLHLNYFGNLIRIGMKRLGAEYNSLGQIYLRNNLDGYYVNDLIRLADNRVYLTFGWEAYKDNFRQADGNPITDIQTLNFGVQLYPGPQYPNINFMMRNYLRDNGLMAISDGFDTREDSRTRDITLNIIYNFEGLGANHSATASYIDTRLIDNITRLDSLSQNLLTKVNVISLRSEFGNGMISTLSFSSSDNETLGGRNTIGFTSFNARGDIPLLRKKLMLYAGFKTLQASGQNAFDPANPSKTDYSQSGVQFGTIFNPAQRHALILDVDLSAYNDSGSLATMGALSSSFSNSTVQALYEFRF